VGLCFVGVAEVAAGCGVVITALPLAKTVDDEVSMALSD